jgi:hypothetical protein
VRGEISILGCFENGRLVAGILLYFERRMGFGVCTIPSFATYWGVVIEPLKGKATTVLSREEHILRSLAAVLAKKNIFFNPSTQICLLGFPSPGLALDRHCGLGLGRYHCQALGQPVRIGRTNRELGQVPSE